MSEYYTEKMRLELLLKISTDQFDKAELPMNPSKAARHHKETVTLMNEKINNFLDEIELRQRKYSKQRADEELEIILGRAQMNKQPIVKKSWWQKFKEWIWED